MKLLFHLEEMCQACLQYLAVSHFYMCFFFGPLLALGTIIYVLLFTSYYPFVLLYFFWIYYDRKTPLYDGRSIRWVRNSWLWKYYRDYFPQRLVKTAELPPSSNYILCTFPHGIMCSAAFAQYVWLQSEFTKSFPGIEVSGHTLDSNFYLPLFREYALALGMHCVSKETLLHKLKVPCGHAVNLVIGGSAEAMKSAPGSYRLVLKNRKGFVKLALTTGTPLVPVFIFGEVDLYYQHIFPEDSTVHKIQQALRKWTGVAPCLFRGTGPFFLFPRKVPITMVVGKPISVEKLEKPSNDQVDALHEKFIQELNALFEEHKHKYLKNPEETFLSIEN